MARKYNKKRVKNKKNKVIGIYTLNGIEGKSAIRIKHLETGTLDPGQRIKDTSIYRYEINSHIVAEVFACNITDSSLMSSKKQPVLYVTIVMSKPLKAAILCNIVLYFTIEDEVKTKQQFLGSSLNGKFTLELFREGQSRELDKEIGIYPGNKKIIETLEELTKNEAMVEALKELADIEEAKLAAKYKDEIDYFTIPESSISLRDYKLEREYDEEEEEEFLEDNIIIEPDDEEIEL